MLKVREYTAQELKQYEKVDPSKALAWDRENYQVTKIQSLIRTAEGAKKARAEYTRLRDIAQKRIKRLSTSEWNDTEFFKTNQRGFAKLREMNSADFAFEFNRLSRFVASRQSTILSLEEIRERSIKTLRYNNYSFVNKENYKNFGGFMQTVKELYMVKNIPNSDQVAELYNELNRGGIDWQDIFKELEGRPGITTEQAFQWWVDRRNSIKKRSDSMDSYDAKKRAEGKDVPAGTKVQRMMKRYKEK